jgi:hypothetical protein
MFEFTRVRVGSLIDARPGCAWRSTFGFTRERVGSLIDARPGCA